MKQHILLLSLFMAVNAFGEPVPGKSEAIKRCPKVCNAQNGGWSGDFQGRPNDDMVCYCSEESVFIVPSDPDSKIQPFATESVQPFFSGPMNSYGYCPSVCSVEKGYWLGRKRVSPTARRYMQCQCAPLDKKYKLFETKNYHSGVNWLGGEFSRDHCPARCEVQNGQWTGNWREHGVNSSLFCECIRE